MNRIAFAAFLPLLGASGLVLAGCNASPPPPPPPPQAAAHEHAGHEHKHDHEAGHHDGEEPDTYAEAVKQVDMLCGDAKAAFAAKDLEKADIPVHKLGHVLEDIPELAKKESMPADDQEAVKKAVEELFDCFGKIDNKLHGNEGNTYDELAPRIDAALQTLHSKLKP
jgi:hypothetical protein